MEAVIYSERNKKVVPLRATAKQSKPLRLLRAIALAMTMTHDAVGTKQPILYHASCIKVSEHARVSTVFYRFKVT
ncbi:MAG: hypothetical protein HZC52_01895 [Planctomycetes bacterium]|nr:hypothetical protein [Planctomycetota bacterium]